MLEGMETAARFSCAMSPKRSSTGNVADISYTSRTSSIDSCHTTRLRKLDSGMAGRGSTRHAGPSPIAVSALASAPRPKHGGHTVCFAASEEIERGFEQITHAEQDETV
jgi:hypothetical protein